MRSTATLVVLAGSTFAAVTTEVLPVGLLPQLSSSLRVGASTAGLLVSVYAITVAVVSIPLASVLVRWSDRAVLTWLLCGYAVTTLGVALAPDIGVALAARVLGGVAHAGFFTVVVSAAVRRAPPERAGSAIAVVSSGAAVAFALGVPLGTVLGSWLGWRESFAVFAAVQVVLAVAVFAVLRGGRSHQPQGSRHEVLASVVTRPMLAVAAVIAAATIGHYSLYTYADALLSHVGVAVHDDGLALFAYGAAGLLGLAVAGVVVDRRPGLALTLTVTLVAIATALLGIVGTAAPAIVLLIVWGAAFGGLPTLAQRVAHAASTVSDSGPAMVNSVFNIGISLGAVVGGQVLSSAGVGALAATAASVAALGALLSALVATRVTRTARGPHRS